MLDTKYALTADRVAENQRLLTQIAQMHTQIDIMILRSEILNQPRILRHLLINEGLTTMGFQTFDDPSKRYFCKLHITVPLDYFYASEIEFLHHEMYLSFENNFSGHAAFLKFRQLNLGYINNPHLADVDKVKEAIAKSEMYTVSYVLSQLTREGEMLAHFPPELILNIAANAPSDQSSLSTSDKHKYVSKMRFFRIPEKQNEATASTSASLSTNTATNATGTGPTLTI